MWWSKQHICLRYLDFSVSLIISTSLIMRSRLSVPMYYNFLSFFIYCYPFCLLVCCDIYFVKKRLKTLLQLFKKWLQWCNRTLQFLKRLILTIHILKKINLHFQVKGIFLSPGIFRTGGLFKTLWNVDQTYVDPCHRTLFSHIQNLVQCFQCRNLPYSESWHIHNPSIIASRCIFRTFHMLKDLRIFRTVTYLKSGTYSEPSQKLKIAFFAKIVKNCN